LNFFARATPSRLRKLGDQPREARDALVEIARRSPKLGDTIEIVYRGKHPERDYHLYSVTSDGDLAFSWSRFGGPDPSMPNPVPTAADDEGDEPPF
jgi:hypothetical protein